MQAEDRARGSVGGALYASYLLSYGAPLLALIAGALLAAVVAKTGNDWCLALWSTDALRAPLGLYVALFLGTAGASLLATTLSAVFWARGGLASARALHGGMMARLLRAPMAFFDATPLGRVLNRCTADVAVLDKDLPGAVSSALTLLARIGATLVVQAVILPWTLLGTLPLSGLYAFINVYFRATSRELKRLDLASKSLASALVSECAAGQATLAAYRAAPRFQAALGAAVDENLAAYWAANSVNRWLGLRLDWLGSALLAAILLAAVFSPGASPGLVGLAITYAMAVTGLLNWLVRSATDCESLLSSAERVLAYGALPQEARARAPAPPPAPWPSAGAVVVRGAVARYRAGLAPALAGVSFAVPAGAKVGIVGRTGSGKSSLALALFRVLELEAGAIEIDGVDIAGVGLLDLRQALSIVPQDATLFAGTVRSALDPLGLWAEAELSEALRQVNFPAAREWRQQRASPRGYSGVSARPCACRSRTFNAQHKHRFTPPPPQSLTWWRRMGRTLARGRSSCCAWRARCCARARWWFWTRAPPPCLRPRTRRCSARSGSAWARPPCLWWRTGSTRCWTLTSWR